MRLKKALYSDDRNENILENLHLQKALMQQITTDVGMLLSFSTEYRFFKSAAIIHLPCLQVDLTFFLKNQYFLSIDRSRGGLWATVPTSSWNADASLCTYMYSDFFVKGRIHTRFCACVDKSVIIILVPKILFELSWFNSCAVNRYFAFLERCARPSLTEEGM